jgi:D-alanyl-D-alanine carboxypeptidase
VFALVFFVAVVFPATAPGRPAPASVPTPIAAANPAELPAAVRAEIDAAARKTLAATGVPSASVSIVRDGRIVYLQAYGKARLDTPAPATPPMRYSIGSISKQFTACAVMLLVDERKLSLDDPVSHYLPELTRAGEVTIRQLLSHTSGYQDYWPQDYVPPFMRKPVTAQRILDLWARKPLDFDPGTQWQYSNTNYVIAGLIVEKVAGTPLFAFLQTRIFTPLGMTSVASIDTGRLGDTDPTGYMRYALGPPRPAPKEGVGWLFAAGELAMTAQDLARWNIAVLEGRVLSPGSWREMQTDVRLKNGLGTGYGLGLNVTSRDGRRVLAHGGEVSGFTASNTILPDDRAAVSVLTNEDAADASATLTTRIVKLLFANGPGAAAAEARARRVFEGLQQGRIDRSQFTDNANDYFSEVALRDFAGSLAPLGTPNELEQTAQRDRGGMTFRRIEVRFSRRKLAIFERDMPDGKIEQFQIGVAE